MDLEEIRKIPTDPESIKHISPQQKKQLWRAVRAIILWGPLLSISPILVLLIVGLSFGIVAAIPAYLALLIVFRFLRWKRDSSKIQPPWKTASIVFGIPLGTATLLANNPLWFQIELSISTGFHLLALITKPIFRNKLPDMDIPGVEHLNPQKSIFMKAFWIIATMGIGAANVWITLTQSIDTWLWFRCLAIFAFVASFTGITMFLMVHTSSEPKASP